MNSLQATLWSKEYLSAAGAEDTLTAQIEQRLWRIQAENGFEGRLFVRIRTDTDQVWIAPVGVPVQDIFSPYEDNHSDNGPQNHVFLPTWMIDSAGFIGMGETVQIEMIDNRDFESATRITLRVVDSRFYNHPDIKQNLEEVLSSLGVIRQGTLLQVPCGIGQVADVYVSKTEPSEYVLCQGEEVAVEFEEPVDAAPAQRPPTPIPEGPSRLLVGTDGLLSTPEGTGGPFSGSGYRLGSSNAVAPPPWRRPLVACGAGESKESSGNSGHGGNG